VQQEIGDMDYPRLSASCHSTGSIAPHEHRRRGRDGRRTRCRGCCTCGPSFKCHQISAM